LEGQFDVLVTVDTKLRDQQNLEGRRIAIIVLAARTNRLVDLSPLFPACAEAIAKVRPGEVVSIGK
jgi:hypothetical protein